LFRDLSKSLLKQSEEEAIYRLWRVWLVFELGKSFSDG
jgi:hypothetical protein